MKKIFVIILNWNRPELTIDCLKSVSSLKSKSYNLNIVVVDNASSDDSVKKLKKQKIDFHLIQNSENLGFAAGNNEGIKYALKNGADWIMVLNNDTVVDKNLIKEFLKHTGGKVGILTPKIYFAEGFEFHKDKYKKSELGKVIWSAGGEMDWQNVFGVNRGVDEVDKGQFDKAQNVNFASGTCMFMNAKMLKKIGPYDPKFFMYFEDVDLSQRALKEGWKIVYVPKALVWHKVSQSSAVGGNLNDYFITRNRLFFAMRWAPIDSMLAVIRQSLGFLVTGRKAQKRGVRDFLFGHFGKGSYEA